MKKFNLKRKSNPKKVYSFSGKMKAYISGKKTNQMQDNEMFSGDWLTKRHIILGHNKAEKKRKPRDFEVVCKVFEKPKAKIIAGVKVTEKTVQTFEYIFEIKGKMTFDELVSDCLEAALFEILDEHEGTNFEIDFERSYSEIRC